MLILSGNQLSSLPEGLFEYQTNLTMLDLSGNQLSSLPDGLFNKVTLLILSGNQLSSLPDGLFDRVTSILNLSDNQLSSLPDGLFKGIFDEPPDFTGFELFGNPLGPVPEDADFPTSLNLTGNPGAPLPLTVSLEKVADGQFKAVAPAGSPLDMVLPLTIGNGSISSGATTITIPAGSVESETLTITRTPGTTFAVTVDIGTLPELPSTHKGYALVKPTDLPLVFTEFGGMISVCERTPQVRNQIWARTGMSDCRDITEAHLAAITRLDKYGGGPGYGDITALKLGDFDGLTNLRELNLHDNQLSTLPAGLFGNLNALETLNLHDNQLSSLPTGLFDNLTNLTELSLHGNQLSTLPAGLFDNLTALGTLSLYDNQLSTLPAGLFDNLTALGTLSLYDNQLSSLPAGLFDNLTALQFLLLLGNQLSTLPAGLFDNLTALQYLDLSGNQLSSLPDGLFGNLTALEGLYLYDNQLSSLPAGLFGNLTNLPELYLHDNQLSSLPAGLFGNLTNPTYIELGNNQLSSLPAGLFGNPTELFLGLNDNQLSSLPAGLFGNLTNLTYLNLTDNLINPLPLTVSLEKVAEGQFKAVAPSGAPFEMVLPLTVANGNISGGATTITIPAGSLESEPLTVTRTPGTTFAVTVDIGTLPGLPADHSGYTLVKSADLPLEIFSRLAGALTPVSERTPQVRDAILGVVRLNYPSISNYADITEIHLAGITSLYLNNSNITALQTGDFDGLTGLTELRLNGNQLTTLPADIFSGLSSLVTLDLSNNPQLSLPDGIFTGLSLTTLDLSSTPVSNVPPGALAGRPGGTDSDNQRNNASITVSLEKVGEDQVKAVAPTGAPFEIVLPLSVVNGSIDGGATTITIPSGSLESEPLTVTRTPGTTSAVTVDIGTLPGLPTNHSGYAFVKSSDLPLVLTEGNTPNESVLTLTVGAGPGAALRGYNPHSVPDWNFGSLSSRTFVLNGVSYTLYRLYYSVAGKRLEIQTSPMLRGFELHLDSHLLRSFSALDYNLHQWNNVDLNWSVGQQVQVRVVETTPIPPGAPTNFTATPGYEKVTLSWEPPTNADPTTLPVTEYEFRVSDDGGNTWNPDWDIISSSRSGQSNRTSCTIGDRDHNPNVDDIIDINLTNGTSYTFEIRARGGDGSGDAAHITAIPGGVIPVCDRTPQVRDAILGEISNISDCALVTEAHLATITRLSLDGQRFTALKAGDFDGLTALTTLILSNTPLNSLPAGIFDNLTALTLLNLSGNQLSSLPEGLFDNLNALTTLELGGNQLSSLPAGLFDNLNTLTGLGLLGNQLSSLPAGLFDNLNALTTLALSGNQLSSLPEGLFDNLNALTTLNLGLNQLSSLPEGIFGNLNALTSIVLNDNQLNSLPEGIFDGLSSLTLLYLHGNTLDPMDPFRKLPLTVSLEKVGADQVKAVAPSGAPFDMVLPLTVTNGSISGGATTLTIPAGSLESQPLTVTRTSGTTAAVTVDIGTLPGLPTNHSGYAFVKSSDLPLEIFSLLAGGICDRTLQVQTAILAGLQQQNPSPSTCGEVTETHLATGITSLFLNGQSITALQASDFAGLTSLTELRLYDNQLTTLPADLFDGLTVLTTLYLNGNQLSSLPEGLFDGLSSLTTLYLYGNAVDPLPLTVSLEKVGADQVKAVAPAGAPFDLVLPLTVTNGSLSGGATTITIPAGSLESQPLTVTRTPSTTAAVTMDIGTLPRPPTNHSGYTLVKSADLPLEVISATTPNTAAVNIPDANLRANIETALGKTSGDPISPAEIATLTSLSAQDASISDLTGLETATNLTELQLWDNNIADIAAVAGLTKLTKLYLWGNTITDLSHVAALTNLTDLRLGENSIANVSAVAALTQLTHLHLNENSVSDISAVAALTNLTELRIGDNTISSIAAVASLTKLEWLDAPNNSISDMAVVANLTNLNSLDLSGNSISDLSAVAGLTNLLELYLAENAVSDLSPLVANTGLGADNEIDVQGNLLDYPSIYTHIPALQARSVFVEFDNRTPTTLVKISGDSQQGTPETALAQPFVVEVQDANNVAFTGVPVAFAITAGGGTLSATNTTTDANGQAASTLTLGNSAGTNTVQVSVQGISQTATFTAEATTTDTAVGEGTDVTTYNVGDTIPLPSGFQTPRLTIGSGRAVTADNGTYTCVAAVDCIIANGAISQGTIEVTTSAVASNTDETPVVSTLPPVCDRTPQVRDAIVAAVPSVSDCNDVTEAHLAAITGTLSLIGESITALAAGDFAGLTALENLNLRVNPLTTLPAGVFDGLTALELLLLADNALTTLPAGVFDGLTALTGLDLQSNALTTLPVGVFDGLTALTELWLPGNALTTLPAGVFDGLTALELLLLGGNDLTTLPAGVFDGLTALTGLDLSDNPGAPFAPKAVALPDDGTIPVAGGTVMLDGSGSGGSWGTNVTYGWALTSPASGVTVTFDDDTSATPVVTIPALTEGTELTFTLTVTAVPSGATGTAPAPDIATVTATASTAGICGRTPQVQTTILRALQSQTPSPSTCGEVTKAHLTSDITSLFLNGQGITTLQAGDFEDLTSLAELRLYDNQLTTLPADLFDGLTALTMLYLNGNQLSSLPDGLFDGLASLATLYLYGNAVDPLPLTVSLDKVGADQVKAVAPAGAPFDMVLPLTVANGSISGGATTITIPAGGVESQLLTVTRTPGTSAAVTVDIGTLPGLPANHSGYALVKSVDLPLEVFSLLAGGICDRTPLVQTTILRALQSQTPSPSTCGEVTEAHLAAITTSLDFREQSITALQAGDFDGLTALTTLNLFDNQLSSLPAGIFDNLTALTTLYLQNNQLSSLPAGIGRLTALTTLNLSHNELSSLPAGIFDNLTALTDLRLLANQLSSLPTGIGRLTALTYLQLGGNNFTTLPAGIFDNLSNLRQLYLGGNELGSLPAGIFDNLTALTTLLLGGIELSSLPAGIFDNLTTLRELQLGSNNFTTLPAGIFDNLTALTSLNLSYNQLSSLPAGIFDNLTALLTLYLHRNSVDPLSLTVSLEKVGADQVKAVAPSGAPFNLALPLTVTNGSLSGGATTITIPAGSVESQPLTVTRTSGTTAAVTVDIGTLPGLPSNHQGYALVKSADLPLTTNTAVDESTAVTLELSPTEVAEDAGTTTLTVTGTLNGAALTTATDVTLTISGTATRDADYSATVLPLTIPAGSVSGTATLTLSLVDDSVEEDDETVIITATTTTGLTLSPSSLTVTITDNDTSVSTVTPVCDRTPQVRDAIVAVVPGVSTCGEVTKAHLTSDITSLFLKGQSITNLQAGDFDGLNALRVLNLQDNQLSSLPEGIFDNLSALTWLGLENNQLTKLPEGIFDGLNSLTTLGLALNRLTTLPEGIFDNLSALTWLGLASNRLTTLPEGIFDNLNALGGLHLAGNQLSTLPAGVFSGLSSLTSLYLDGNAVNPLPLTVSLEKVGADQVKAVAPSGAPFDMVLPLTVTNGSISGGATTLTIPAGSLESQPLTVTRTPGTTAAVTVDIGTLPGLPTNHSGYALVKSDDLPLEIFSLLAGGICDRTSQVQTAILAGLQAQNPSPSTCAEVTAAHLATGITSLFLNGQSLTALQADDFEGLTSLQELRLYDNQLTTLPDGLFDGLTALTTLYLNGNQLSTLPDGLFDGLSALTTLYLYGNSVDPLPLTVSLQKVGADQVKAVAPAGAPFEIVLPLTVANGGLSSGATTITIPAGSLESQPLTVTRTPSTTAAVTMDIGTLPRPPTNHSGYELVKSADLPLEVISATTPNTAAVNIPDANLRANIETALGKTSGDPISPAEMATLTSLAAQDASISDLTGLETATNLTELQLWDNEISNISAVAGLTNLTKLYLWGNAITDISHVAALTNLTDLRLGENSIANVSAVAALTNLTHLYLRENSVSDIAAVAGLTNLTELRIGDNTISSIAAVANLTNLVWLDAPNNSISDLAAVANLTSLTSLTMSGNSISDLSAVAGLTDLLELFLAENAVSDLSPLVSNTGLGENTEIDVQGNPLSYPSIYTHIPALQARSIFIEFDNRTPTTLAKVSGDSQQGTSGTALAQPFVVEVQDANSGAFVGVPVAFAITAGGGTLSATSTATDANGRAASTLTLGNSAGTNTVQVSVQGISQTETFTAEATTTDTDIADDEPLSETTYASGEEVPTLPTGFWTPDETRQAAFSFSGGKVTIEFNNAGEIVKDGITYTCASTEGCTIEDTRVTKGIVRVIGAGSEEPPTTTNNAPVFTDGANITRTIAENTSAGVNISTAIAATDADNDVLTYTLGGTDAAAFAIDSATGQLKTNAALDYETKSSYSVVVTVSDDSLTDTINVTINVTDLDESLIPVCDRTPQVRDAIVAAVPSVSTCGEVTKAHLTSDITSLFLDGQGITTLQAGDFEDLTSLTELRLYDNQLTTLPAGIFDGLTGLTRLYLNDNQLSTLPEGLFDGLSSLTTLYLYGNAVDPLPLTVSLEKVGTDQVKAVAPTGAPFEIVLPLTVTNGSISGGATTITIPAGSLESESLTVVHTSGTTAAVTVDIGTLPELPTNHNGYALVKSSDLPLVFNVSDIGEVEESIVQEPDSPEQPEEVGEPRTVRLFYFLPNDRTYRAEVVEAMKTGILEVQSFYAEQMETHGYGNKTFQIETDDQGDLIVHRVDGDYPESYYISRHYFTQGEINRAYDNSANVILIVMDASRSSTILGHSYPPSKESGKVTLYEEWDWSTAAHELGHAFDLRHDFRSNAYIMSYGWADRESGQLSVCAADFLAVNPYFDSDIPLENESPPTVELISSATYPFGSVSVSVQLRVRDDDGLHQVILLSQPRDPSHPPTPAVRECRGLAGETDTVVEFNFAWRFDAAVNQHSIYVVAVDTNGNSKQVPFILESEPPPQLPPGTAITPVCDRTPQVRDAILDNISGISDCAQVTETHLVAILGLNLQNRNITALKAGDFDGLISLTTLWLQGNQLSSLPAGLFDHLDALTTLWLQGNQLSSLPTGLFDHLDALTTLWLQGNQLTGLPEGLFDGLTALEELFLNGNQLSTLPEGLFDGLTTLTQLRLYGNSVDPLLLTVSLEKVGTDQVKAIAPTGAPFEIVLPLTVTNGSISGATSITIPAGSLESLPLTVTRTPSTTAAVTMDMGTLPGLPANHSGYALGKSTDLPLEIIGATTPNTAASKHPRRQSPRQH